LDLLRNGLPEGGAVAIRTEFAPNVPAVMVDPQGLRQVIWNLCLNAVEAMQHQGTLTIRTAVQSPAKPLFRSYHESLPATQELVIEVVDTGPGMPSEVKEKMFEPFYSTKSGGTGLGLATVERIIYNHKGRVVIESQLGHGTTIRVHLPFLSAVVEAGTIHDDG
jgi:signal transduction histidine kinase